MMKPHEKAKIAHMLTDSILSLVILVLPLNTRTASYELGDGGAIHARPDPTHSYCIFMSNFGSRMLH